MISNRACFYFVGKEREEEEEREKRRRRGGRGRREGGPRKSFIEDSREAEREDQE
jgi:hypothetical protein